MWQGGCAWQGACVAGGHAWRAVHGMHTPQQILRDTVNERAVRILLECILLQMSFYNVTRKHVDYIHDVTVSRIENSVLLMRK